MVRAVSPSTPIAHARTMSVATRARHALMWFLKRLPLWLLLIFFLLPVVWTITSSLKTRDELFKTDPHILVWRPTLANYTYALQKFRGFGTFYRNSVIVALGAAVLQTALATLAGYGFARIRFRGRDLIFYSMILLIFVPQAGGLMAQYELMNFLGLRNNLFGLILLFSGGLALPTFIMRQAFLNLPGEFEDAAYLDGCNRFQTFRLIMLPMATGAMVIVALLEFTRVWGEYLITLTMIVDPNKFTLGVAMAQVLIGQTREFGDFTSYGAQAAAFVMAAFPVVVFFLALQRWFVRGLMEGLKF